MPAKLFVMLISLLTSVLVLTSPSVLTWVIATPTPTPTTTPLAPTFTPSPTATLDPFANIPTATPLGEANPLQLQATPFPTLSPTPTASTFNPAFVRIGWNRSAAFVSPLTGRPVEGRISQGFGCSVYFSGRRGPDCPASAPWFHAGLDLAASAGTPVRAALSGTVTFAGPDGRGPRCGREQGYGLGVVIEAGEWQALYAHLAEVRVAPGQAVEPDTVIGRVGASGCATGAHLHFGLKYRGQLVDPLRGEVGCTE